MPKGAQPTAEQVNEVKTRFLQKLKSEPPAGESEKITDYLYSDK